MNVTKAEFMSLIKTFKDFDEETQLRIYNNWRTFQQMFWLLEHHPLAWMLIKSAINDVYHKSVAQSN